MMKKVSLKKTISERQIKFYLKSCTHFRFPFYDPNNCYRQEGLFGELEEVLIKVGEKMRKEYGKHFLSINLRGSWLRGIPIHGDDVDVLFIVNGLPHDQKTKILDFTRQALKAKNELFHLCEGKEEFHVQVDPITFLDIQDIDKIMNTFMYGLGHLLFKKGTKKRDRYQDKFIGSTITNKKTIFLKSGILIPYVGWIYGCKRKKYVFNEIGRFLPIPTQKTRLYSTEEINETKETLRQAFIARNLIYPSTEIKSMVKLTKKKNDEILQEACQLYKALEPLEHVYARAVINYLYTRRIEQRYFDKNLTKLRVEKFAPSYDMLVKEILDED